MKTSLILSVALVAACSRDEKSEQQRPPPPPAAKPTVRGTAGDRDLRALLNDVASGKACEMFKGQFRALRAKDRPEVATGTLWIRDCHITPDGTFTLVGNGWQWIDQTKKKAKGKFEIEQYVRFGVTVTMPGAFDIAYDRGKHIVSLYFTPSETPQVKFDPMGDFDVDRKGVWSSIVGGLSSVFSDSPEEIAEHDAEKQGVQQFEETLGDGLEVTIDLCTGLSRFNLGRRPKGKMQFPDVGETKTVPVELHPGGIAVAGPVLAPKGLTIYAESQGPAHLTAMCAEYAENSSVAMMGQRMPSPVPELGAVDVNGKAKLRVKPAKCPVAIVAKSEVPATVAWSRPPSEIARSTGGPILKCQ
jgi:hypothetical protein